MTDIKSMTLEEVTAELGTLGEKPFGQSSSTTGSM